MAGRTFRSSATASRPAAPQAANGAPQAAHGAPQAAHGAPQAAHGAPRAASGASLTCRAAATRVERDAHFMIRRQVFVVEQGLFGGTGDDRDRRDHDPATIHVVGLADGVICGTVRLYPLDQDGRWKGDRLAVLASHRHLGLGAPLVRFAVGSAGRLGGREMEAFIQPANVAFFRWLGWRRIGDLVEYAGVPHQRMLIALRDVPGWSPTRG